jgi:hypothetical protein
MANKHIRHKVPTGARPASKSGHQPSQLSRMRDLLLAILGLVATVGFAIIVVNFWVGVAISAIASLLLVICLYAFIENSLISWSAILVAIATYVIVIRTIFVPASVSVMAEESHGDHAVGADIYGTTWRGDFSEVTAIIKNYSSADMLDLNLRIATDLLIAGAGIAPGINSCTSEAESGNLIFGNIRELWTDKVGKVTDIPLLDWKHRLASSLYRIRCERLSARSSIEIKLPILNQDWPLMTPKKPPRWAVLWISLMAGSRPVQWRVQQCFVRTCTDIPTEVSQVPLSFGPSEAMWSGLSGGRLYNPLEPVQRSDR